MKIKVWKNDNWETLSFKNEDQLPGIRNSRTIVPISTVLNYLGFETRWITTGVAGDPSILRAEKGNEKIVIYDGESYFDVTTTYGNEEDCIRYVFPEYAPRTYLLVGGEFMTQIRDSSILKTRASSAACATRTARACSSASARSAACRAII